MSLNYSHPESPVRHSYPVASTAEGFSAAFKLLVKTMPCVLAQLGVMLIFAVGVVIWLVICGGIASLFVSKDSGGGIILFLIVFGIPAGVYGWLKRYVLYVMKLGHIAVVTAYITEGKLPEGIDQLSYGKKIVHERFAEVNVLFVVDSLVQGVTRAFNGTLDWIASFLPIPGLANLMVLVNAIVNKATTYLDETIFSYNLARGDDNVWRSSADGLVYYAQNVNAVLKTAVWGLVLEYLLSIVTFLVALVPAALISHFLPGAVGGFAWVLAIILAVIVREAVIHPLFYTMVALTFHVHAKGQQINIDVSEQLSAVSNKFVELKDKASNLLASQTVNN